MNALNDDTLSGVRRRTGRLTAVLAAALLVALVVLALVARGWQQDRDLAAAGRDAEQAARQAVVAMTSYDYRTIEEDFAWVDTAGTVSFRKKFTEASAPVRASILALKAQAEGEVVAAAHTVQTEDRARVLLFVDQTITDPERTENGIDQPRVVMTMVREGDRWLVDDVELFTLAGD